MRYLSYAFKIGERYTGAHVLEAINGFMIGKDRPFEIHLKESSGSLDFDTYEDDEDLASNAFMAGRIAGELTVFADCFDHSFGIYNT